jgi:hypothetical protein
MTGILQNVRSNGWGHRSVAFENITSGASGTRTATSSIVATKVSTTLIFSELSAADQDLNVGFHQQTNSLFQPTLGNQSEIAANLSHISSSVQLFTPELVSQDSLELNPSHITSTLQLFAPTINFGSQSITTDFISSAVQLFTPTLELQFAIEESIPHIALAIELFQPTIGLQINLNLNLSRIESTLAIIRPVIHNEGSPVFEPTLLGNGSLADQIMAGLIDQGFIEGSIADREYARLLAKLSLLHGVSYTMADLYFLAEEPNRLAGIMETV